MEKQNTQQQKKKEKEKMETNRIERFSKQTNISFIASYTTLDQSVNADSNLNKINQYRITNTYQSPEHRVVVHASSLKNDHGNNEEV